jgi:hypothetical protein
LGITGISAEIISGLTTLAFVEVRHVGDALRNVLFGAYLVCEIISWLAQHAHGKESVVIETIGDIQEYA